MATEDSNDNDASKYARIAKHRNIVCFQHEFFQANQPRLLQRIKRATREVAPIVWPTQETESKPNQCEDTKEQLVSFRYEMKKHLDSFRDEFDLKLARAKTELEIDYLRRINAVEVCYKDLILMHLRSGESSVPSRDQTRAVPGPVLNRVFLPVSRSNSGSNQKLDLLLPFPNGRKRWFDNMVAKWPLPKNQDLLFGSNTGTSGNKNDDATLARTRSVRTSLNELLPKSSVSATRQEGIINTDASNMCINRHWLLATYGKINKEGRWGTIPGKYS